YRHTCRSCEVAGRYLVAKRTHGFGRWPDEDNSGGCARACELGVLRQETVTGMNGIDIRFPGDAKNVLYVEVGLDGTLVASHEIGLVGLGPMQREAILLRIDRHGSDPELRGGTHDTDRDLAPIGDQDAADPLRHERFASKMRGLRELRRPLGL